MAACAHAAYTTLCAFGVEDITRCSKGWRDHYTARSRSVARTRNECKRRRRAKSLGWYYLSYKHAGAACGPARICAACVCQYQCRPHVTPAGLEVVPLRLALVMAPLHLCLLVHLLVVTSLLPRLVRRAAVMRRSR